MKNGLTQYKIFVIYYDNIFFLQSKKIYISNTSTLFFCAGGPKHQGGQSMDEGEGREQGEQDDHYEEELDGHDGHGGHRDNYVEDEGDGDDNMAMCNMGEGWYLVACYWDGHWARAVG